MYDDVRTENGGLEEAHVDYCKINGRQGGKCRACRSNSTAPPEITRKHLNFDG